MRLRMIIVIGAVLGVAGCAEGEQASAEPAADAAAPASAAVAVTPGNEMWHNETFVEHMHLHAEKLDELNYALADGNLAAAKDAANWISTHDTNTDMRSEWMPFLYGMRAEAEAVEAAPDIAAAQAASQRIVAKCAECHVAVGVSTE